MQIDPGVQEGHLRARAVQRGKGVQRLGVRRALQGDALAAGVALVVLQKTRLVARLRLPRHLRKPR